MAAGTSAKRHLAPKLPSSLPILDSYDRQDGGDDDGVDDDGVDDDGVDDDDDYHYYYYSDYSFQG